MCSEMNKIFIGGANPEESEIAPIHAAAMTGDLEAITLVLSSNVDINHTDQKSAGYSALTYATIQNRVHIVKLLIENGANVNLKSFEGSTALHAAAMTGGNKHLISLLLDAQADVNAHDVDGITALNLAATKGFHDAASLLIDYGANVDTADSKYLETPLMNAVYYCHEAVVDLLLSRHATVEMRNCKGATALIFACSLGNVCIVRNLIDQKANVNDTSFQKTPLYIAAERGHISVVKELLSRNADVDTPTSDAKVTSLYVAAKKGKIDVMSCLIKANADVDFIPSGSGSCSALMYAASLGNVNVMDYLMHDGGADVNLSMPTSGLTSLHIAAREGRGQAVAALMRREALLGVLTIQTRDTALLIAARGGHDDIVKMLLMRGGKTHVNQANVRGEFPLLVAAKFGHYYTVDELVEAGANVNQVNDQDGTNALFHAVTKDHRYVALLLLNSGSDTYVDNFDGTSLLFLSVMKNWPEHVEIILKRTSHEVNLTDKQGETPLYYAAKKNKPFIVEILLRHNADPNQGGSNDGTSPLMISSVNGFHHIVKKLLHAKADVNQLRLNRENALHMIAEAPYSGSLGVVVDTLFEYGCSFDAEREDGLTPMNIANRVSNTQLLTSFHKIEFYRNVARSTCFKRFSEHYLSPLARGKMPIPMAQWVSIMKEEHAIHIFKWAKNVSSDCSNCYLLFYNKQIHFADGEYTPWNLREWRMVIHDGTAALRQLIASFLVPEYRTRRLARGLLAFGMVGCNPTAEALSTAVVSSLRAVKSFNRIREKYNESRSNIHEEQVCSLVTIPQGESDTQAHHLCDLGRYAENICNQPLSEEARLAHRKRPSIFAFKNSNCKVVSATRGTY